MPKKITTLNFIERAVIKHGYTYNYSRVNYTKFGQKIIIGCKQHGFFHQIAGNHLRGAGCAKCASENSAKKRSMTKKQFIDKANIVHNNVYDYSLVIYKNSNTKIKIVCGIHGQFEQLPTNHIYSGFGCLKCGERKTADKKILMAKNSFVSRSKAVHGTEYDYTDSIYISSDDKIKIKCKIHGTFLQKPLSHISGSGCPGCHPGGFNPELPGILYYIKDITCGLYKIGITNKTIKKRFSGKMKDIKILGQWYYEEGSDAVELEAFLHKEFNKFQELNENFALIGGKTEFFNKDVLNKDKVGYNGS